MPQDTIRSALLEKLQFLSSSKRPINDETDVLYDLKLGGDDLEELLVWMRDEQSVDFSSLEVKSFPLNEPPQSLYTFWGRREFEGLPVRHLVSVIGSGKWTRP